MRFKYKYALSGARTLVSLAVAMGLAGGAVARAGTMTGDDSTVQEARDALRARDKGRLLAARDALMAASHPLAPWADYWYFQARLVEAGPAEVDEFLARWPDSYVADRARNDWLLELGRRQDWRTFLRIQPTFRMNDDRDVSCLGVLARYQSSVPMEGPGDWREQARQAWWGQKDADYGCDAMAQVLVSAGLLSQDDVWRKLRLSVEADKPRAVTQSGRLLGEVVAQAIAKALGQPQAFLMPTLRNAALRSSAGSSGQHSPGASIGPSVPAKSKKGKAASKAKDKGGKVKPTLTPIPLVLPPEAEGPLNLLAFIRWASMDPVAAAAAMGDPGTRARWKWSAEEAAWAWAQLGRAAAWRLSPEAPAYFERALADRTLAVGAGELRAGATARPASAWSAETLAWMARAGLRAGAAGQAERWALVEQAVDAMAPDQQQDSAWIYWRAKALQARARAMHSTVPAVSGEGFKQQATDLLNRIAGPLTFYGQLAAEELHGAPPRAPAHPVPLSDAEIAQARSMPGVVRALRMLDLGWRGDAIKEWNFTVGYGKPGGLSDRELLAVSEEACRREIWDRCINSSERTRQEISLDQRYPTPYKRDVLVAAREVGLDPAYMYGLIRQESRFILAAKSNVGASGLMQVMPATAAWTAHKLHIDYQPELITERTTNLRIGAGYLKLVLDDFQGTEALAAAAYNAGPSRSRRWRDGPRMDAAAWVENIPFNETRDYVKKVLSNATVYAHILQGRTLSLKTRLGAAIGPRAGNAPPTAEDLP